jgi:hypothetical protein
MCRLTKLHCLVCDKTEQYLFQPCGDFIDKQLDVKTPIVDGKRFFCYAFKWPLDPTEDTSRDICEECLEMGRIYYHHHVALRLAHQTHAGALLRFSGRRSTSDNESEMENVDDEMADLSSIPPNFQNIPYFLQQVLVGYYTNKDLDDAYWSLRAFGIRHRSVRVLMPCCPVCRKPTMRSEEDGGGMVDVEFAPSSILQDWLIRLQNCNTLQPDITTIQTSIKTQFISKACDECIKAESKLRDQVRRFLGSCERYSAWSVYSWILSRGISNIPVLSHASMNVGLPTTPPPDIKMYMELMALSWKRLTGGLSWEDTVEYSPPVTCPLVSLIHDKPLLSLSQWKEFVDPYSGTPLGVRAPTPGEVVQRSFEAEYESSPDMQNGEALRQWSQSLTNTSTSLREQLSVYDDNPTIQADNIRAIVAYARHITTLVSIQPDALKKLAPEASARKDNRTGIQEVPSQSQITVEVLGRKMRKRKAKREDRRPKAWGLACLVAFKGLNFDENGRPAKRPVPELAEPEFPPRYNGSRFAPSSADVAGGPLTPITSSPTRQVGHCDEASHAFNTPGVGHGTSSGTISNDNLFGSADTIDDVYHSAMNPSASHEVAAASSDIDMQDHSSEMGDDEALVIECDRDCFHWFDGRGTQPGDLVHLPLGQYDDDT